MAYSYDPAHRLVGMADGVGNSITYVLDPMGNRLREEAKDPAGVLAQRVTREYNASNRLQKVTGQP